MPTIRTTVPYTEGLVERPCAWCGGGTDIMADTPFRPDLKAVPMHLFCAADVIHTFNAMQSGGVLSPETVTRVARLAQYQPPQLTAGDE